MCDGRPNWVVSVGCSWGPTQQKRKTSFKGVPKCPQSQALCQDSSKDAVGLSTSGPFAWLGWTKLQPRRLAFQVELNNPKDVSLCVQSCTYRRMVRMVVWLLLLTSAALKTADCPCKNDSKIQNMSKSTNRPSRNKITVYILLDTNKPRQNKV